MQLSVVADPGSEAWDVAVDGRWLGAGPGDQPVIDFDAFDPSEVGSARLVAIWLADGDVYSLSALRPANAKGQDKDEITVTLPESRADLQVFDPRLSTGYDADGTPRRFGVELWLGSDPDGDQSPVRLSGESEPGSESPTATPGPDDGSLGIYPMRARGAAAEGIGLYLLVRR